jgi:uncharacterized protein
MTIKHEYLKLFFASILLLLFVSSVCSQGSDKVKANPTFPKPTGFVNDYSETLDAETRGQFERVLSELQKRAKIDFAIALIKSTNGKDIFDYSLALAKDWKVGSKNGGILLVVAIDDRKWFIQIDKRLEQDLTNAEVKQIGETMIEDFKQKLFADGIKKCMKEMILVLSKKQKFEPVKFE